MDDRRIAELEKRLRQVEERLKAVEGQVGGGAPAEPEPHAPGSALPELVKQGARQAVAAMADRYWEQKLQAHRPMLEAQRDRLTRMEPFVAELKDALYRLIPVDRTTVEPIHGALVSLKSLIAGSREALQQAMRRRPESLPPVPDLPAMDLAPEQLVQPDGRLALGALVQQWQEAAGTALSQYYTACRREVDNAAAGLEQQLGKGSFYQVQDRAINAVTMIYRAAGEDLPARTELAKLLPAARNLVEALGLTLVTPEPGRDHDVYSQDLLDYDSSSDLPAGTVCRVVEPGFKRDGKLLIKPRVLVSGKRL